MKVYVFWESIAGPQYSSHSDGDLWYGNVAQLINGAGHGRVYVYETEAKLWYRYSKGIRGRLNEEAMPEDEVPKVFKLLLTLES